MFARLAEDIKLELRVKDEHGGGYRPFTIAGEKRRLYVPARYEDSNESSVSLSAQYESEAAYDVFSPSQKYALLKDALDIIFDDFSKVKNCRGERANRLMIH